MTEINSIISKKVNFVHVSDTLNKAKRSLEVSEL